VAGAAGPIRIEPAAVAEPRDLEDLARLVTWASVRGIPLFARGAGTGMPGGNVGPGVCVDFRTWSSIGTVETDDRTIRVGPGAIAEQVDRAARARGLFLPSLPSSAHRCTIGGMVANNAAGARSFRYGAMRTWVEALEVVLADGTVATLERGRTGAPPAVADAFAAARAALAGPLAEWPEVRKNASGYALDRALPTGDAVELFVGSEGTLGFVTSVRLRLAPLPSQAALLLLAVPDLDALHRAVAVAAETGVAACEVFARRFLDLSGLRERTDLSPAIGAAPALLMVEVDGTVEEVESRIDDVRRLASELDTALRVARDPVERERLWEVRHAASPIVAARADQGLVSMQFIEDSVVPPDRIGDYLLGLDEILEQEETDAVVFGHAGDGNVHVNPLMDVRRPDWRTRASRILERTVDLVVRLRGTLSGEHGDGRIRAPFHERVFGRRSARAFLAVKDRLDPHRILNPGVLVAEPGQEPLAGLSPEPRVLR